MKKVLLISILMLAGCAARPGSYFTGPGEAAIKDAIPRAQTVYANGANPKDGSVKVIIKDLGTAQTSLVASHKQIDDLNSKYVKAKHRIYMDDWIFGIPMALIAGLIGWKIFKIFLI